MQEAERAGALNPNAPSNRQRKQKQPVSPPAILTQAQLDARGKLLGPAKNAENQRKKKGPKVVEASASDADSDDGDEDSGLHSDNDLEKERLEAEEDEEEDEEDQDEDEDEDEDEGEGELLQPTAKGRMPRRKRKLMKVRKKRSLGFFLVETANDTVRCVLCEYSQKQMRSDNIVRHWRAHHSMDFAAVEAANDSGRDVASVVRTLRAAASTPKGAIDQYVSSKPKALQQSSKIMKEVALLRWMVVTKMSFNSLDSDCFREMLDEWGVMLESRSTMLNLLTPLYEHALALTETTLKACAGIACTFDLWTSGAGRKYIAVTYHGIDNKWRMVHCVLDVVHFHGSTQSEVIAAVVRGCIEKHLPKDKLVTVVVSDGAGDTKHAREDLLDFDGHDCFNHDLNLSLGDALKVADEAAKDFATMEHLIREIESDKNLRIFFDNMQKVAGFEVAQKFVHRNDTRWTGLIDSVAKFLKLGNALRLDDDDAEAARQHILADWPLSLSADVFQDTYWQRLKAYHELLVPVSVATKLVQSLSLPTSSRVPKLISDMKNKWTELIKKAKGPVKAFGSALLDCLSQRCDKYIGSPGNTMKAAALDPSQSRFLHDFGVSKDVIEQSWEAIVKEALDEFNALQGMDLEDLEDDTGYKVARGQVDTLRAFLSRAKTPSDSEDPLQFYRENVSGCTTYAPLACRVATNLLAIPAGESHSERVFSWAGGFVTKLRNRLSDETLQELVFLYDFFRSSLIKWPEFRESFSKAMAVAAAK